eukprot:TRINITY_DN1641_c0_g1_i5.p1 TRINITY_DN1641_c0_g1~~TRINITY_DN1641_c0_g1_i5.p1  ORF type:complete len:386 (-),score=122.83 TRINITY_DN1641_c0_g1_i5:860-2017(-)
MTGFGKGRSDSRCKFRTLATRLRPAEVVYNRDTLNPELKRILQNSPIVPSMSPLGRDKGEYNYIKTVPLLEKYFGTATEKWPDSIRHAKTSGWHSTISALGILMAYLEEVLQAKQILNTSEYEVFDVDTSLRSTMTLDSQALQHLEVLEVQGRSKNLIEGSLLHYLDKTMTPFGKREIKRWLCAPLYEKKDIELRLDAVGDLVVNKELLNCIRRDLQKLPDLEKKISRLYTYGIKQEKSPILFENLNVKKLVNLKEVLNALEQVEVLYKNILRRNKSIASARLKSLTTFTDDGGIVPLFSDKIKIFNGILDWNKLGKGAESDQLPEPNGGVDQDYDQANETIKEIKRKLDEELVKWQEFFKDRSICYVHKKEVTAQLHSRGTSWK